MKYKLTDSFTVLTATIKGQYTYYIQFLLLEGRTDTKINAIISYFLFEMPRDTISVIFRRKLIILECHTYIQFYKSVFLNRRAAAQYRARAPIMLGPLLIKEEFIGPQSHKGWEPQLQVTYKLKIHRVNRLRSNGYIFINAAIFCFALLNCNA
jgi:hypothetical protein